MGVTVSIVVHNSPYDELERAVACLCRSRVVDRIEIIDNGTTDTLRVISSFPKVRYRKVENRGFGAGHNEVIGELDSSGDSYHLVMNSDVWWEGDVVGALKEYMDSHKDVGMVMPKVFYPDGALQLTCRMLPTPLDLFSKRFLPSFLSKRRMERYLLKHHDHDKELNCPYLLGSFLFFRNSALKQVNGFDERFFMYPEDIDITRRIHESYKTMYWPGVSIIHAHKAASRKSLKMLRIHTSNMIRYFNKWGWWRDKGRREFNRRLQKSLTFQEPSRRPRSRG